MLFVDLIIRIEDDGYSTLTDDRSPRIGNGEQAPDTHGLRIIDGFLPHTTYFEEKGICIDTK